MTAETKRLVSTTLEVLADPAIDTESCVVDALRKRGIDRVKAEKLLVLVPLAFGRVLISHLADIDMPDSFEIAAEGEFVRMPLKSEPIFLVALALASDMFHSGPRELFKPAAIMSAELQVVNKALYAVETLDGGVLASPVFMRLDRSEWESDVG